MDELEEAVARSKELKAQLQILYNEQFPLEDKIRKLRMLRTLPLLSEVAWRIGAAYADHEVYRLRAVDEGDDEQWFESVLGVLAVDGIHNSNTIRKGVRLCLDDGEATIIVEDANAGAEVVQALDLRLEASEAEAQIEKHRKSIEAIQAMLKLARSGTSETGEE